MLAKTLTGIMLSIVLIFTAAGCSSPSDIQSSNKANYRAETPQQTEGNVTSNVLNGGHIAKQGDWIYYSYVQGNGLYKIKTDGTMKSLLDPERAQNIIVMDDWVYFSDGGNVINRIGVDGKGKRTLTDELTSRSTFEISGDMIYYKKENRGVFRMRTDGTDDTQLSENFVSTFIVSEDAIYYLGIAPNTLYGLCRMNKDGSETILIKIHDEQINPSLGCLNQSGDWIIYREGSVKTLIGINIHNKQRVQYDLSVYDAVVSDGWIYCTGESTDKPKGLYRMKADGSQLSHIAGVTGNIYVIGNFIYFFSTDGETRTLNRMKTDGTGHIVLDKAD